MPAIEQLRQGLRATGSLENIILVHSLPRQIAALLTEPVAQSGEFLFLGK
jgi:adenosylmethionine-8-amino-7-oxononanoate aminotransferase